MSRSRSQVVEVGPDSHVLLVLEPAGVRLTNGFGARMWMWLFGWTARLLRRDHRWRVRFSNPRYLRFKPGLLRVEDYATFEEAEQRYLVVVQALRDRQFDLSLLDG
jgi:hypothetical protein